MEIEHDKSLNRLTGFLHPALIATRQIRLLRLCQGRPEEGVLRGELKVFDIEDLAKTQYRALSYEWGSGCALDEVRKIEIDGTLFHIRKNLYDFWRILQKRHISGYIYIDAICINQLDHVERQSQVSLMARIFRGASEVIAWLGEYANEYDECLHMLSRRSLSNTAEWSSKEWKALDYLSHASFWVRLWVVQEIALARKTTIWCGQYDFSIALFGGSGGMAESVTAGISSNGQPDVSQSPALRMKSPAQTLVTHRLHYVLRPAHLSIDELFTMGTLEEMTDVLRRPTTRAQQYKSSNPDVLSQVFRKFGKWECSDPRDKLYGLIGLLSDSTRESISPDYGKDVMFAFYQALKAGIEELLQGLGSKAGNESPYMTYYCDVRNAFGLEDNATKVVMRRVLKEVSFAQRVQEALLETQWQQQLGWGDAALQSGIPQDWMMEDDPETQPPSTRRHLRFHRLQYAAFRHLPRWTMYLPKAMRSIKQRAIDS